MGLTSERVAIACVLCGPTIGGVEHRCREWTVVRCSNCGLRSTQPVPDEAVLAAAYDDASYYDTRSDPSLSAWEDRAREILAALPEHPSALLDFGAGEGDLVAAMRRLGIPAEGIDPAPNGRTAAAERHGITIEADLGAEWSARFSAVTLVYSLEHVRNPVETLTDIRQTLEPAAYAFIEVPHARSADMAFRRRRDAILDLPLHLHHFTPSTLAAVVRAAGFEPVSVKLFNSAPVSRALAWRQARQESSARRASAQRVAPTAGEPIAARPLRDPLAPLRRRLPGAKFQLIAHLGPAR